MDGMWIQEEKYILLQMWDGRCSRSRVSKMFGKQGQWCDEDGRVILHTDSRRYLESKIRSPVPQVTNEQKNPQKKTPRSEEKQKPFSILKKAIKEKNLEKNELQMEQNIAKSYNARLANYNKVKDRIFNDKINEENKQLKQIRNTREKFKAKKRTHVTIKDTILKCEAISRKGSVDPRAFADIKIGEYHVKVLLDTGASISILGKNCEKLFHNLDV